MTRKRRVDPHDKCTTASSLTSAEERNDGRRRMELLKEPHLRKEIVLGGEQLRGAARDQRRGEIEAHLERRAGGGREATDGDEKRAVEATQMPLRAELRGVEACERASSVLGSAIGCKS